MLGDKFDQFFRENSLLIPIHIHHLFLILCFLMFSLIQRNITSLECSEDLEGYLYKALW